MSPRSHRHWLASHAAAESRDAHISASRHWWAALACIQVALLVSIGRFFR